MTTNPLDVALQQLEEAANAQRAAVSSEQVKLAQLEQAIQQLRHTVLVIDPAHMPKRKDYEHMGIVEAARAWLMEVGGAHRTEDIAKVLLDRGLKTKSKRMTPNVYATLRNSDEFVRDGDKWKLRREQ